MPETGNKAPDNGAGAFSADTAKTILVPAELYRRGTEYEYLSFNGMAPVVGESVVVTPPYEVSGARGRVEIVAIMAVPHEALAEAPAGQKITSPLLQACDRWTGKREVNMLLTRRGAYIAVRDKGLRMAEAFPDNSIDSLLYYMQVIGRRFNLRRFDINVAGVGSAAAAESLRGYFANVRAVR